MVRSAPVDGVLLAYGSRVAQRIARDAPGRVRSLVLSPPMPGVGRRVLEPVPQREYWYQSFHRLGLPDELIDGRPDAVRRLEEFFSEVTVHLLEGVGHFTPLEAPEQFAGAIRLAASRS